MKEEVRAMTNRPGNLERPVVRSSVMPSLKYSCSGSLLRLANGSTAMEGLSGKASAGFRAGGIEAEVCSGLSEICCTSTIVAAIIVRPAREKTPGRTYFLGTLGA